MTHSKNKVKWCLKKAEKELKEGDTHRGLVKINPDIEEARKHIEKAEHYIKATHTLKKTGFSDISASTIFYSMYHCFLAIGLKFGYESGNQECTFALMQSLSKEKKIDLKRELLEKVATLDPNKEKVKKTSVKIREQLQYGTSLSLDDDIYKELLFLAQEVISKTKEIVEE